MTQSRTHTCNELRLSDAGKTVTLVGWYENLRRVSKNLGFLILRDFYGTTQIVIETEEMMEQISGVNTESTISVPIYRQWLAMTDVVDEQRNQLLRELVWTVVVRAVGHDGRHTVCIVESTDEVV